jgi:hypothetical protein
MWPKPCGSSPILDRSGCREPVTLSQDEFHGPYVHQLPDLTVLWDQSFPWTSVQSPRFGTPRIPRQDGRSGSHTPYGLLLATEPGLPARLEIKGGSIYDVAPTVLSNAVVPIPADLHGRALLRHR